MRLLGAPLRIRRQQVRLGIFHGLGGGDQHNRGSYRLLRRGVDGSAELLGGRHGADGYVLQKAVLQARTDGRQRVVQPSCLVISAYKHLIFRLMPFSELDTQARVDFRFGTPLGQTGDDRSRLGTGWAFEEERETDHASR